MKNLFNNFMLVSAMLTAVATNAANNNRLFIIGDATHYGWDLDWAQALMSTPETPTVFTGTLYLKGGENNALKFMEVHEWGGMEYGTSAENAANGEFELASGTLDEGYNKIYVAEEGNYFLSIDTEKLTGLITRSEYQESEIKCTSLFLVGDATEGGWSVEDGTPLYQSATAPYEYSATVALKSNGSFKIASALRGGGSFDAKYFYFRDGADDGKISPDSTDDRQWRVSEDGDYTVTVNMITNAISINRSTTGMEDMTLSPTDGKAAVYYDLQGNKVSNPSNGVFIKVAGDSVTKLIFK